MERLFTAMAGPRNGATASLTSTTITPPLTRCSASPQVTPRSCWAEKVGTTVTVHAGDVAVLPAGTGHCRITASDDFLVIGAYPPNEHWDICRTAATPEVLERMRHVSFPASDPVTGASGALPKLWQQA